MPHDAAPGRIAAEGGASLKDVAEKIGIRPVQIVPKISVEAGINAVKMIFSQCYFDERKCEEGLDCLRNYHKEFDYKRADWKQSPYDDYSSHAADAFRYFAVGYKRLPRKVAKIGGGVTIGLLKKYYPRRRQVKRRSATGY